MPTGESFTFADYQRWPTGAQKAELIHGGLRFVGDFTEDDIAVVKRTYPAHEVYLDEGGIWVLPAGTGGIDQHLAKITGYRV